MIEKNFNQQMWDNLVEYALAEGIVHMHSSSADIDLLKVEDCFGQMGLWIYNKKDNIISLADITE